MSAQAPSRRRSDPHQEVALAAAPHDAVFERWAAAGLVWLPEWGMGRLRVTEAPYDADYFEKYQGYAETPMGRAITEARVDLVARHHAAELIDVGIGCGDFVHTRLARGLPTWGFDVNPVGVGWLHSLGRWRDPYERPVDAVSLWDTLEHIPDPAALLSQVRRFVFVSLPIVPGAGPPPLGWKHFRRDEHCWYWTSAGFVNWMTAHGFRCVESTRMETDLGRSDIGTFVFQRENAQ